MKERVILVTGGAGNLGREVTRVFLEGGARVVVPLYKTDQAGVLDTLRKAHPEQLHSFALDLTTERGAEQAVGQVVEWGGRIDGVAHLIGGYSGGRSLVDTPMEEMERMLALNLKSAWLISRFALPKMVAQGAGTLVFVSSRAALQGRSGHGAYAIAKSALITLVEVIAEEYGSQGIRANAVLPGTMDTAANRAASPKADRSRWTDPAQIARVIAFLSSSSAAAVNGAAVPV